MKWIIPAFFLMTISHGLAQLTPDTRKQGIDSELGVVYMEALFSKPIQLFVAKDAPVFSDKDGKNRLGTLMANQTVRLEAISERSYRVRGRGKTDGIAGWVGPWAFTSEKHPDFENQLKALYQRQIQVQELIAARAVAVGMTYDEVTQALGKPKKTSVRKTETGETSVWEFVEVKEIKHYVRRVNPVTGDVFRQLSHVTQEETKRTNVEFTDQLVSAVEHKEDHTAGNLRIVVPPLVFGW